MNDILDADDIATGIEKAVLAFQQIAMSHPASDDHSREIYRTAEDARQGLVKILATYNKPSTP